MLPAMQDPESPAYDHPAAETVRNAESIAERQGIFAALQPYVRYIKGSDPSIREHLNMDVVRSAWQEIVDAANRHNDPGNFTTFIAYEYTSAGRGEIYNNLHRNVVFAGATRTGRSFFAPRLLQPGGPLGSARRLACRRYRRDRHTAQFQRVRRTNVRNDDVRR